jgi:hypothetical protein
MSLMSDIFNINVRQSWNSIMGAARTGRASKRRRAFTAHLPPDPIVSARLTFALQVLAQKGQLVGARTKRMSARVDPGLLKAAKSKTGLKNDSDLISAALAVIAASDDFGPWFAAQAGRLSQDFTLDF